MSTRTPEAAGTRPRAPLNPHQATQELILLPPAAMDRSKRAVDHRPLAEAGVVGNRGRPALVVQQVEAVVAAGAVADEAERATEVS